MGSQQPDTAMSSPEDPLRQPNADACPEPQLHHTQQTQADATANPAKASPATAPDGQPSLTQAPVPATAWQAPAADNDLRQQQTQQQQTYDPATQAQASMTNAADGQPNLTQAPTTATAHQAQAPRHGHSQQQHQPPANTGTSAEPPVQSGQPFTQQAPDSEPAQEAQSPPAANDDSNDPSDDDLGDHDRQYNPPAKPLPTLEQIRSPDSEDESDVSAAPRNGMELDRIINQLPSDDTSTDDDSVNSDHMHDTQPGRGRRTSRRFPHESSRSRSQSRSRSRKRRSVKTVAKPVGKTVPSMSSRKINSSSARESRNLHRNSRENPKLIISSRSSSQSRSRSRIRRNKDTHVKPGAAIRQQKKLSSNWERRSSRRSSRIDQKEISENPHTQHSHPPRPKSRVAPPVSDD